MGIKLVIVDDAPFIREAIRQLIEETEITVVGEAADGVAAVQLVLKTQPDLVLMDLVLPKKNGIEATRDILAKAPDIKIVACSTESQEGLVLRALDAGCKHYVSKPFEKDGLLNVIRRVARGG